MIASFYRRYPGANNPGVYLAAYWPILAEMKETVDQAYGKKKQLTPEQLQRLVRWIDRGSAESHADDG